MVTAISIYEPIGRNLGDVAIQGTPTSSTGTTIVSNVMVHPLTDQLQGMELYIYEGEGSGQARIIKSFDPSNNRITIDPAFAIIPTSNSRFIIFKHFALQDYENAMNRAMGRAKLLHLDDSVATMQMVGSQYEYPVPSGMEYISNLRLVPSGSSDYEADTGVNQIFELPPRYWEIERNSGGTYLIVIDPRKINIDANLNEQWFRIIGQSKPDFGGTTIPEDLEEYIINSASMLLASQRISEGEEWRTKFQIFREMTRGLEEYIHRNRYGRRVGG